MRHRKWHSAPGYHFGSLTSSCAGAALNSACHFSRRCNRGGGGVARPPAFRDSAPPPTHSHPLRREASRGFALPGSFPASELRSPCQSPSRQSSWLQPIRGSMSQLTNLNSFPKAGWMDAICATLQALKAVQSLPRHRSTSMLLPVSTNLTMGTRACRIRPRVSFCASLVSCSR